MSIWPQLYALIRRFFPNPLSQFCLFFAIAIVSVASPTHRNLVYFGIETVPGLYYYAAAGFFVMLAIVFAHTLPKRLFPSIAAAVVYWVDRNGGLDYAAYYNDLTSLEGTDDHIEPAAERLHYKQLKERADKFAIKIVDEEHLIIQWRRFAALIHRKVQELDSLGFGGSLLGKNEKILFDSTMGGVFYWRMSDREVLIGVTTDQPSIDTRTADMEFSSLGEAILELTSRKKRN